MAKFVASIKAIITRLVFAAHGFVAIWQVTKFKRNPIYWYLSCPIILLFFEGIFTLTIKENQEWKWFCPSVFLYLGSVVPAIWLLELDKVDRRMRNFGSSVIFDDTFDLTNVEDLKQLQKTLGTNIRLPDIQMSTEMWVTLIEQFLMLILIVGRWMLPKGELTRDQLSQLLLVYIGTAADIIEFFDSFKEDRVAREPILVYLTLGMWSWSLMQFTVVLTATKSRKSRLSSGSALRKKTTRGTNCCNIDVWAIAINMLLQDAPFLIFRLILIIHFKIVSYMNIFFTCKNTLVILLQMYRLYVVQSENREKREKLKRTRRRRYCESYENGNISIISRADTCYAERKRRNRSGEDDCRVDKKRKRKSEPKSRDVEASRLDSDEELERSRRTKDETSNSTSSSRASLKGCRGREERRRRSDVEKSAKSDRQESRARRKREGNGRRESTSERSSEDTDSDFRSKRRYNGRKRRSDRD
ncbi:transmembrane protein 26 [Copidosoma floridanum]|uniref:transmembrane protein 26 n=1 Tax=Copidosoma floridanum TaxID=29053 RepID=UPI000C6F44DA|nr:transmembrane protein 26 [Copidosoma floridanum]